MPSLIAWASVSPDGSAGMCSQGLQLYEPSGKAYVIAFNPEAGVSVFQNALPLIPNSPTPSRRRGLRLGGPGGPAPGQKQMAFCSPQMTILGQGQALQLGAVSMPNGSATATNDIIQGGTR
eukprot:3437555-Prymnesium_polylepis.1